MNIKYGAGFFLIGVLFLSGCLPAGKPSESIGRESFTMKFDKDLLNQGYIVVKNFKKIDGAMTNELGTEVYKMYFSAEVTYPKGLNGACKRVSSSDWAGLNKCRNKSIKNVGEIDFREGTLFFFKTENGWRDNNGNTFN